MCEFLHRSLPCRILTVHNLQRQKDPYQMQEMLILFLLIFKMTCRNLLSTQRNFVKQYAFESTNIFFLNSNLCITAKEFLYNLAVSQRFASQYTWLCIKRRHRQ